MRTAAVKIGTLRQTLAFTHERHEVSVSCAAQGPGRPSSIDPCSVTSFAIQEAAFFGTLLPFLRAFERPMAMACLRLLTLPPVPL